MATETPVKVEFQHLQLKDRVYEHLLRGILNGDFVVGAALRELDIATSLGVSKTPVREAFVRLQRDRFVKLIPYRGAIVAGYERRDLREVYEVRELIEGGCAARAAESADDQFRSALQRNVRTSRDAVRRGAIEEVVNLFEEFDQLIYSQFDNTWIGDLITNVEGHQRRIGRLTVEIPGRMDRSVEQHERICKAIVERDATAAEQLMRKHVVSVMTDQLEIFSSAHPASAACRK